MTFSSTTIYQTCQLFLVSCWTFVFVDNLLSWTYLFIKYVSIVDMQTVVITNLLTSLSSR